MSVDEGPPSYEVLAALVVSLRRELADAMAVVEDTRSELAGARERQIRESIVTHAVTLTPHFRRIKARENQCSLFQGCGSKAGRAASHRHSPTDRSCRDAVINRKGRIYGSNRCGKPCIPRRLACSPSVRTTSPG